MENQTNQPIATIPEFVPPIIPQAAPKSFPKILLPVIFIVGLVVGAGGTFAYFQSVNQPANVATSTPTASATPNVTECNQYHDIGYMKALAGRAIDDNTGVPSESIPEECKSLHDQGYEAGSTESTKQYAEDFDNQRRTDLLAIANAVYQYASENNGSVPHEITNTPKELGTSAGKINLSALLAPYIASIPYDPQGGNPEATGYSISMNELGRLIVEAKSSITPDQKIIVTR